MGIESVGVDGCRAGWIAIDDSCCARVFARFADILEAYPDACFFVDMPMGLPDSQPRDIERQARAMLKGRASSVFAVPSRRAIYADSYRQACEINLELFGRKLSLQAWNICPRIREIDGLLEDPLLHDRMIESHPELVFSRLAGAPLEARKCTAAGIEQRMAILGHYCSGAGALLDQVTAAWRRADVGRDDIVDALALMVCGTLTWHCLVDFMGTDDRGIPIRMAVPANVTD